MSVNITLGDIIEVRLEFGALNDDSRLYNVLHYRVDNLTVVSTGLPPAVAVPYSAMAPAFAADVFATLSPEWAPTASQDCAFLGVTTQDVHPSPRSRPYTYTAVDPVPGTVTSEMLPAQDCPTILKKTLYGERWGLGRMFLVGTAETGQDTGILNPAAVDAIADFADVLDTVFTSTNGTYSARFTPVLFSDADPANVRINFIDQWVLSDQVIKTQRRRRPGKGE